jgi:SWI/SNF-related matrix-associated actin-dependent regulator 1 of chromatin subfamily A
MMKVAESVVTTTGYQPEDIMSMDGKKLFHFQCEGVRFLEKSGGRAMILDEMGLGKTVQVMAFLILHPEARPFLWIGKSSLKYQYQYETMRWGGVDWFAQVVDGGRDLLLPGFTGYIASYDILRRMKNDRALTEQAKRLGIKTLVLDECQQIKNSASQRTIFTRELAKQFQFVFELSGTPIKNHAAEFFPSLNIVRPDVYNNERRFIMYDCDTYWNGFTYKTGGLANPKQFHERTKNFIIRRERAEVLPDLPKIQRSFSFHELGSIVEKAYIQEFKQFRDEYNRKGWVGGFSESDTYGNDAPPESTIARLSRLRHLTGWAKIDPCVEFAIEFLGSTDRKLTIFTHHNDVADTLVEKLNMVLKGLELEPVLHLTARLNAEQRYDMVAKFTNSPKSRILVASTLASGEGLNLQVCSDCILLERQWNPANEEQAEGRFPRPGSQASSIAATYFTAVGTVDEFFAEIVERKREIVHNTLSKDGKATPWDQSSIMKELAETLAACGGQKWSV